MRRYSGTKTLYTVHQSSGPCIQMRCILSQKTTRLLILHQKERKENQAKLGVCILACINHKDKMPIPSLLHLNLAQKLLPVIQLPHFRLFFLFRSACFFSSFISHEISLKPNTIFYITPLRNKNSIRLQSLMELCPFTELKKPHCPKKKSDNIEQAKTSHHFRWT